MRKYTSSVTIHRRDLAFYRALHPKYPTYIGSRILPQAAYNRELDRVRQATPDVVFLDALSGAVLAQSLARDMNIPLVYRSHNVQYQYMKELFKAERKLVRKAVLYTNIWRDKAIERRIRECSYLVYDITPEDRDIWQRQTASSNSVVLNYFLHPDLEPLAKNPSIDGDIDALFVGNLHTPNNVFGLRWFAASVAPSLRGLRIVVAGAAPARELTDALEGVGIEVIANPEEVQTLYERAHVLFNPVRHGSGVNIKMIELLATGKPVISTTAGTRGLAKQLLKHVGVADEPKRFAKLLTEHLRIHSRSTGQQDDVIDEYGWENVSSLIKDLTKASKAR